MCSDVYGESVIAAGGELGFSVGLCFLSQPDEKSLPWPGYHSPKRRARVFR